MSMFHSVAETISTQVYTVLYDVMLQCDSLCNTERVLIERFGSNSLCKVLAVCAYCT
jgi:hypothetical protein